MTRRIPQLDSFIKSKNGFADAGIYADFRGHVYQKNLFGDLE